MQLYDDQIIDMYSNNKGIRILTDIVLKASAFHVDGGILWNFQVESKLAKK